MKCPNCNHLNPQGARFCSNCGAQLQRVCTNCGTGLPPGARFCHNCGQAVQVEPLAGVPASPAQRSPAAVQSQGESLLQRYIPRELLSKLEAAGRGGAMEGERRVVTILFCDMQGSTLAASRLDPEEWAEIINGAFEFMIQPVYRYEGTVARLQGDGLLAFFGAPIAHEDDPERAVLAGLSILDAIQPYSEKIKQRWGIDFNVRVGINTGLVVVGAVGSDLRMEYTALGDAINMAARMEQSALPGTVLLASPTYRLVAPLFEVEQISGLEIKGRAEPVTAYRILGRKVQRGSLRGLQGLSAPLIGRQTQLDALLAAVEQVWQQGSGQIVSVCGEAGLGKSRLVSEFRQLLADGAAPGVLWLEGRTLSYDSATPFAPFANLFNTYFDLQTGDEHPARYHKITNRLVQLMPDSSSEAAPFIAALLGVEVQGEDAERINFLEPPALRGKIFKQVIDLITRILADGPVILYLDDLHWADPTSIELLQALLPLTDHAPLMVVAAYRPRRQELSWQFHTLAERDFNHRYHLLMLDPLDASQSKRLVSSLLQIDDLPEEVRLKIMEKSEGNPFFVEEVIRSLLDSKLVVRVNEHWQAAGEIRSIEVPDTLVGVITARLDRLEDSTRHILQSAAILGREFPIAILEAIIEAPDTLDDCLVELQRRDLLREKARLPRRIYSFKHVLTQEAAYNTILLSSRRELHRRAADALIDHNPEATAEIARHLLEARQASRAVPYLVQAGESAARAYASGEAIAFFRQALEYKDIAEEMSYIWRAYAGLGDILTLASQIGEAQQVFDTMRQDAERLEDISARITALNKLASITALHMGQFQPAEQLLAQAENLARSSNELSGIPDTNLIRCMMCSAQADFDKVVVYMDEVVSIGRKLGNPNYIVLGMEHVANSLMYMLRLDEARQRAEEGLRVAREIGDRAHEAYLLSLAIPLLDLHSGDYRAAENALNQSLQIAVKIGVLPVQALASYLLADIARWRGEYESALSHGHRALGAGLPLEPYTPFLLVPILGCLGSIYQEISNQFVDKIAEFHRHAMRLLESPTAAMTAGVAWADLGHCAIALGDLEIAEQSLQKGVNSPNIFTQLERPRNLAGLALLASARGQHTQAAQLAAEAFNFAEQHCLGYYKPFTALVRGKVLLVGSDLEGGLAALEQAIDLAQPYLMRPVIWQAHAAAVGGLISAGKHAEAEKPRAAAQAMVADISGLFEDQELRQAFLRNALAQIP